MIEPFSSFQLHSRTAKLCLTYDIAFIISTSLGKLLGFTQISDGLLNLFRLGLKLEWVALRLCMLMGQDL